MLIQALDKVAIPVGKLLHKVAREKVIFSDFLTPTDEVDQSTITRVREIICQERPDDSSLHFLGETYFGLSIKQGIVINSYLKACKQQPVFGMLNSEL